MLRYLFFDLDDTLLDFKASEARALSQTLRLLDIRPTAAVIARYSAINQRHWELLEEKKLTREQVLYRRFQVLFRELGVERSSAAAQAHYESFLAQGADLIPGAKELLAALSGRYAMYLVSNGTPSVQDSRLALSGLDAWFDGIFISQRLGADKPSRAFFTRCFAAIPDFDPAEALILGDSLTSDIQGGVNAGIRTCWYNPRRLPRREDILPDYEIQALSQFPALLEGIAPEPSPAGRKTAGENADF